MSVPSREEEIFCTAVQMHTAAERMAYVNSACRDDTELRHHVLRLLDADHQAGTFLEKPFHGLTPAEDRVRRTDEIVGGQLGNYKLLRELGEGGMGTVFLAEQQQPVKRAVAIKLLKSGMDSRQVVRRFEAERQTLALMDHPHVAQVFDAGVTASGRPYFVMELVCGLPIVEYCDGHKLSISQRLQLFKSACRAIQHAHQKGVIHRDVKPSNVLVCQQDGQPIAKVIDFGVAKLMLEQGAGDSALTEVGQFVGTPEYMSPEQAQLGNADVDTRSDIYSLGILLFELLTSQTPLDRSRTRAPSLDEILRMIREDEPPKPSNRLHSLGPALTGVAERRNTDAARLLKQVRGDLDWIVMKCLEKDRARRYETAAALTQDVDRHLRDEPVLAGPPSVGYRLRKLTRRHKVPVVAGCFVLLALIGGSIGTSWGLLRARASAATERQANQQLEATNQDLSDTNQQLSLANQQLNRSREETERKRQEAEVEKTIADNVNEFLQDLLRQADSATQQAQGFDPNPNLTVPDALLRAAASIEGQFTDQPLVEAAIRRTIGIALINVGRAREAIPHLQRARLLYDTPTGMSDGELGIIGQLSRAYSAVGQSGEAATLLEDTLARLGRTHGEQAVELLPVKRDLLATYVTIGNPGKAIPELEACHASFASLLGADDPETLRTEGELARAYCELSRYDKGIPLLEDVVARAVRALGEANLATLSYRMNLAASYTQIGRPNDAIPVLQTVVEQTRKAFGSDHPKTWTAMNHLANAYYRSARFNEAIEIYQDVLQRESERLGETHPSTLAARHGLANATYAAGQLEKSLPLAETAFQGALAKLGPHDVGTLLCMSLLANIRCASNPDPDSIGLFEQALALSEEHWGSNHILTLQIKHDLGGTYLRFGQVDKATPLLESIPNPGPKTSLALALGYYQRREFDKGVEVLAACADRLRREREQDQSTDLAADSRGDSSPARGASTNVTVTIPTASDLPDVLAGLASFQLAQGKHVEAEPVLRECLALRTELAPDSWLTFNAQSLLGQSLLRQQRFAEAEPLLLSGYEGLRQRASTIPPDHKSRLPMALSGLIGLYETWDKPDEAAKWRQELEGLR